MNPRALIVDADPLGRKLAADALAAVGFQVGSVADGPSALDSISAYGAPEIVIVDQTLPGATGLQVVAALRASPMTAETAILLTIGVPDQASVVGALRLGADDVVHKPLDPVELGLRARNAVARRTGSHLEGKQERLDLVVLFADIRGFTNLAAQMDPETTATILNDLFDTLDGAVAAEGGWIDKFIGDSLMALFGVRGGGALEACRAALRMQALTRTFADESLSLGRHAREFGMGIGIASGLALLGTLGTRRKRQITALGEAVNLAARVQALAERDEVVIDAETARRLGAAGRLSDGSEVHVKGFDQPQRVFRLLGLA